MFSFGDKSCCFITDATMGQPSTLHILDMALNNTLKRNISLNHLETKIFKNTIIIKGSKATICRWGSLNKTIITGHEDGSLCKWDSTVTIIFTIDW